MKRKYFLLVGIFFSILLNVYLYNDIKYQEPQCGRIHTDDIDRSKDVVPDEKAAIKIARLSLPLEENLEYDIEVDFYENLDEWCVSFRPQNKNILDGGWRVRISRYYGIVNMMWR